MREKVLQLFEMGEDEDLENSFMLDSDSASETDIPELSPDLMDSLDLNTPDSDDEAEEEEAKAVDNLLKGPKRGNALTQRQRNALPKILQNVSVILRIINSNEEVNVEEYEKLCKETYLLLLEHFGFMTVSPSCHAILGHSPAIIRNNNGKGLNCHSEEASEGSHKVLVYLREHGGRKCGLELNLKDAFRKMHFKSDPIVRSMKRKVICSFCQEVGHSIKSCQFFNPVEKNEDDLLMESITYPDLTAYDHLFEDDEATENSQDLGDILEEEEEEMEHEVSQE